MLINVSDRKFSPTVRVPVGDIRVEQGNGVSKSAASWRFVALSAVKMDEWMSADLSSLDLPAIVNALRSRVLVARPQFLIWDEPISALDMSIQAQTLNLPKDLQANFGLSVLFISHNLAVVRQMCDQVAILKTGRLVESGEVEAFFNVSVEDYSCQLFKETPSVNFAGAT